jgi:malate/lactate dehydrogenase
VESALIGLAGVLLGVALNEFFRRKRRIEAYAQKVFGKRLSIYEGLHGMMQVAYGVANEVMENSEAGHQQRLEAISAPLLELADYVDRNELYVDRYIGLQAMTSLMGAEDVADIEEESRREAEKLRIRKRYRDTVAMLADGAGITQVSRHLRIVSRPDPDSDVIRYAKSLEEQLLRRSRS